jgi:hypothetical protein
MSDKLKGIMACGKGGTCHTGCPHPCNPENYGPRKFWTVIPGASANCPDFSTAKKIADRLAEQNPGYTYHVVCATYRVVAKSTPILHETELS